MIRYKIIAFCLCVALMLPATAQRQSVWTTDARQLRRDHGVFHLNSEQLKQLLPERGKKAIIMFPVKDGSLKSFNISHSSVMPEALAKKYPNIASYKGTATDDPQTKISIQKGPEKLHFMLYEQGEPVFFIQSPGHKDAYQLYSKDEYIKKAADTLPKMSCSTHKEHKISEKDYFEKSAKLAASDELSWSGSLRTYRLAISTTGEYTDYHGGTVEDALAAIVVAVDRMNTIFSSEIGVNFELIENTDEAIFVDPELDPYTNDEPETALEEAREEIPNIIGNENFDIGHCFTSHGGGIAYLGVACRNSHKAGGISGLTRPEGDPFVVGILCHEMGHQLNAAHTYNSNNESCSSRSEQTAYEPGSGSTIMAYGGLCGSHNVSSGGDEDYFHVASLEQMITYTTTSSGSTCGTITEVDNAAPEVDALPQELHIPQSTPFELTAQASDPDSDELTYCWEQYDLGPAGHPDEPEGQAPLFRSYRPDNNATRTFPSLEVLRGGSVKGEYLPDYAREMNFKVTVRDQHPVAGAASIAHIAFEVTDGDPFEVLSWNDPGITLEAGTVDTIRWDVANTTAAPVNCAAVDIFFSEDGGATYNLLKKNTANDGETTITIPNQLTTEGRFKVKASDNIFFDINNEDLEIIAPEEPAFVLNAHSLAESICLGVEDEITYELRVERLSGFDDDVDLSIANLPTGFTADLTMAGTDTFHVTLSPTTTIAETITGQLDVVATSGDLSREVTLNFEMSPGGEQTTSVLSSPEHQATDISLSPELSWEPVSEASAYVVLISEHEDFTSATDTFSTQENNWQISNLQDDHRYYWKVSAITPCGQQPFSEAWLFNTRKLICESFISEDTPLTIDYFNQEAISAIEVTLQGQVERTELRLFGTHEQIDQLSGTLRSPSSDSISLFSQLCYGVSTNDFNFGFSDTSSLSVISCPPTGGLYYTPEEALSAFSGQEASGTWNLEVYDNWRFSEGGTLQGWELNVCVADDGVPTAITQEEKSGITIYPNPTSGDVHIASEASQAALSYRVYMATGNSILHGKVAGAEAIDLSELETGVYILSVSDDNGNIVKEKIVKY